jgi:ankyrin repeat protein
MDLDDRLIECLYSCDPCSSVDQVRNLLDQGASPHAMHMSTHLSALTIALIRGLAKTATLLIEHGATVSIDSNELVHLILINKSTEHDKMETIRAWVSSFDGPIYIPSSQSLNLVELA